MSALNGKRVLYEIIDGDTWSPQEIGEAMGYVNEGVMVDFQSVVTQVIESNPDTVEKIMKGNEGPVNFLLGQVMKKMKGQVDPSNVWKEILKQLNNKH